jgi:hypothetical protein
MEKNFDGKASNRWPSIMIRLEESLDFIGEDTSERLGAVRLRKVSQKTFRDCSAVGRLKIGV